MREAIRLKPDYTDAYLDLANVFFEEGKLEAAAELYRHVLGSSPTLVQPNYNLGVVLKKQGRWTEALTCFETVIGQQEDFSQCLDQHRRCRPKTRPTRQTLLPPIGRP